MNANQVQQDAAQGREISRNAYNQLDGALTQLKNQLDSIEQDLGQTNRILSRHNERKEQVKRIKKHYENERRRTIKEKKRIQKQISKVKQLMKSAERNIDYCDTILNKNLSRHMDMIETVEYIGGNLTAQAQTPVPQTIIVTELQPILSPPTLIL